VLRPIQDTFNSQDYPDLLVGLSSPDDAALWRLDDHRALVLTTDFFTPVVDDPYDYGAIAAANSLSDIYAMGGQPFLALNIAALPPDLPEAMISAIVQGGAEKAREAGVVIAGGHTVQDKEPKYGLVVAGFVDPQRALAKAGVQPGDRLVLTKPLGFGVTTTALKGETARPEDVAEVTGWMKRLNRDAMRLATSFGLRGGTDVTGFSLLGHSIEMARASRVALRLTFSQVPFVSGARRYADQWAFPGGAFDNREFFKPYVHFDSSLSETEQMMLFDPQTSGGLLLAGPAGQIEAFMDQARAEDQPAWVIGEAVEGEGLEVLAA
jgi:selenide,water dikinase